MSGNPYDQSCMTYSEDGRVYQIEYAEKAVNNGETIVGVLCKDGIILGSEKQVFSNLLEEDIYQRIGSIESNKGIVYSGKIPDGIAIKTRAIAEAEQYKEGYDVNITGPQLADRLGQYIHAYTLHHSYRPLGTTVIIASHNAYEGYKLNMVEQNGLNYSYYAATVGKGKQVAKSQFEKYDFRNLTCAESLKYICKILNLTHEEYKDKKFEIELGWICDKSNHVFEKVPKDLRTQANQDALDIIDQEEQE